MFGRSGAKALVNILRVNANVQSVATSDRDLANRCCRESIATFCYRGDLESIMDNVQQQEPQSAINEALTMAAVDACEMLRKWSDSKVSTGVDDTQITPVKIGQFQQELTQHFAAIYFGTHDRLNAVESSR